MLTTAAVSVSPSASLSLRSTPGAATINWTPVVAAYASFAATGAALVIVIVTVAGNELTGRSNTTSCAWYRN
ncbi:MAG: hypothetical protein E6J17_09360, partial [Chloroflexi bacterium]